MSLEAPRCQKRRVVTEVTHGTTSCDLIVGNNLRSGPESRSGNPIEYTKQVVQVGPIYQKQDLRVADILNQGLSIALIDGAREQPASPGDFN